MDNPRWSDHELEKFRADFDRHLLDEQNERAQQQELYEAVFRKEDKDTNTPPGLLQLMSRMTDRLHDMQDRQNRQKTFVGGVVFTITSAWFFLTDAGPKLVSFLKRVP